MEEIRILENEITKRFKNQGYSYKKYEGMDGGLLCITENDGKLSYYEYFINRIVPPGHVGISQKFNYNIQIQSLPKF